MRVKPLSSLLAGVVLVVAAGCDSPGSVLSPSAEPSLAKPASGSGQTDPTATFYLPVSNGTLGLWGDGNYIETATSGVYAIGNGKSRYREKECGVHSKIFYNGSGDAIMHTDNPQYKAPKCQFYPRKVGFDFTQPVPGSGASLGGKESVPAFVNVMDVQDTDGTDGTGPITGTVERPLAMSLTGSQTCDKLRFRPVLPAYGNLYTGADMVQVTRIDAQTWSVQTKPDTKDASDNVVRNDKVACLKNDVFVGLYHMKVDLYIVSNTALPL